MTDDYESKVKKNEGRWVDICREKVIMYCQLYNESDVFTSNITTGENTSLIQRKNSPYFYGRNYVKSKFLVALSQCEREKKKKKIGNCMRVSG